MYIIFVEFFNTKLPFNIHMSVYIYRERERGCVLFFNHTFKIIIGCVLFFIFYFFYERVCAVFELNCLESYI